MRTAGTPEELIYAYYKTDGLLPCETDMQLLTKEDLEEFNYYKEEYINASQIFKGDSISSLNYVKATNELLLHDILIIKSMLIDSLNDFIHRHSEDSSGIYDFDLKTEKDYLMFSALKTINTIKGVTSLIEDHLNECILALGRSVFETYMYINQLNKDQDFFRTKLLPKIDRENFEFVEKSNGKIDYDSRRNINSGEIFNVYVRISELKNKLSTEEDMQLYTLYYMNACRYVHFDGTSANEYFSTYDPYDRVNPTLITAVNTLSVAALFYYSLSQNENVQKQFQKDAEYFIGRVIATLCEMYEVILADKEYEQQINSVFYKRFEKLLDTLE